LFKGIKMDKIIAIHHHKDSFSENWIRYCKENNLNYKLVNCYSTNIIETLQNCSFLLWHWHHNDYKAQLFARQFIKSIEYMNIKVFPNTHTGWHFDDKVGQKYLFEAINAPFIKSYVFYNFEDTLKWIHTTSFPKVFKLRGGAGSSNVILLKTKAEAIKNAKMMFSTGYKHSRFKVLKEKWLQWKAIQNLNTAIGIVKGLIRIFFPSKIHTTLPTEKNYFYAQDFIPNNDCDIRVVIIGKKAFAIKRMVRKGDFRASGSGVIIYDRKEIPEACIRSAFDVSKKLKLQSSAYDFVYLHDTPLLIELSYAFSQNGYLDCPGYWDENLNWYAGKFCPESFIIEDLLSEQ